ncbi:MAG: shikimate dehydrogenase family protein [Gemmatimonadota bacterium]
MRRGLRLAIAGWPVEHSLSPALWEAMGRRRGLAIQYGIVPVRPDDDEPWVALWASDLDGFNVTAPWKERSMRRCRHLDPVASAIESVNTVIRSRDGWQGRSTDGYGFVRSLLSIGEPLRGRSVAILGTGGAGRAVALAAAESGAEVTLVSRRPERVPAGCEACRVMGYASLEDFEPGPFEVVVNATPLGGQVGAPMPDVPPMVWERARLVVDLNYVPLATALLRRARAAGARTLNGIGMLIHQACLGAAWLIDGDPVAAESYEEDFWAAAREVAPGLDRCCAS